MAALCAAANGEDASAIFKAKYGKEIDQVIATRTTDDDIELALKLLEAAKTSGGNPEMMLLLCEKTHLLANRSNSAAGYDAAIEAMKLAAEKFPAKRKSFERKALAVQQKRYGRSKGHEKAAAGKALLAALTAAADSRMAEDDFYVAMGLYRRALRVAKAMKSQEAGTLEGKFKRASSLALTGKQISQAKLQLKGDPANRAARSKLIRLYLVALDRPADAAKYLSDALDEEMRRYLPLAAAAPGGTPVDKSFGIAEWYHGLARKASLRSGRWVDILPLAAPPKYVKGGKWQRVKGGLRCEGHWSPDRIMIPVTVEGSYELRVRLTRIGRADRVDVMFPVGPSWALLEMNRDDATGYKPPDEKYSWLAQQKQTKKTPAPLLLNKPYTVDIRVALRGDKAQVAVDLNGGKLIRWEGSPSRLRLGEMWKLDNIKAVGLGAHWAIVVFHSVELRVAPRKGKATVLREASKK